MKPKKKENKMGVKWSKERREKFMNTLRVKKNHKTPRKGKSDEFLDIVWNGLTSREKASLILLRLKEFTT